MKRLVRRRRKPFPPKPVQPPIRLKPKPSFLRKHRKFTAYLGAVIVFGTYAVKDGKQQQLRDEMDALTSTRNNLVIVKESLRVALGPMPNPEIRSGATFDFASYKDAESFRRNLWSEALTVAVASRRCEGTAEAMSEVEDTLNDGAKGDEVVFSTMSSVDRLTDKIKPILLRADPRPGPIDRSQSLKLETSALTSAMSDLVEVERAAWENNEHILEAANHLVVTSLRRQSELESSYKQWELYGYLLYGIGWFLALYDKIDFADDLLKA